MAVIRERRDELARALDELVTGQLTNNDFDEAYYGKWRNCSDSGVVEIARFGWSLYSSDLLFPRKLKGRYAVCEAERKMANRAILFLRTDLDYEWPTNVEGLVPFWGMWGPGFYLFAGLALCLIAAFSPASTAVFVGMAGLLAIIPSVHWLVTHRRRAEELQTFYASGDFAAWPFMKPEDFSRAEEQLRRLLDSSRQHDA